jgi:thiosulfate/3-mercaptopyruvate sulfurtransferase
VLHRATLPPPCRGGRAQGRRITGAGDTYLVTDSSADNPAGTGQTLINVAELAGQLAPGQLAPGQAAAGTPATQVVLDVRWRLGGPPGIDSYRAGHLPGAVFVDLDHDLSGEPGPAGRHPMPAAGRFQAAMRQAGVRQERPVVVYDDADSVAAARAWWMLRYFGHRQVRVLDGGYRAWTAAGHPVSHDEPPVTQGDFSARPGHMPLLDAADAAGLARAGLLLDARAGERYRGEAEPVDAVAGHIPGAISAPTLDNVRQDGTFKDDADLRARFMALSRAASGRHGVGVYCGSGVTAAHEVLALERAGITAALYVGSWSNWITNPAGPVATGPDPG